MDKKQICIIGSGAAGSLLLLNLQNSGVSAHQVTVVDPHHDGGDLVRKWGSVRSNTSWKQILDACPCANVPEPWASLDPSQPTELRFISSYIQFLTRDYQYEKRTGTVDSVTQGTSGKWQIQVRDKKVEPILSDLIFLATGSEPKLLDMPFPSIPLHIALDKVLLERFLSHQKVKTVAVFGTAHSGTLIVKNLVEMPFGLNIVNFYASPKPFYFARDGDYDGVKRDAAEIADDILASKYPSVKLVALQDTAAVIRASKNLDFAVYATGFEQRNTFGLSAYDAKTGKLLGVTNGWGFGIAYPSLSENEKHYDVSIASFQAHIMKQMPDILATLQAQ